MIAIGFTESLRKERLRCSATTIQCWWKQRMALAIYAYLLKIKEKREREVREKHAVLCLQCWRRQYIAVTVYTRLKNDAENSAKINARFMALYHHLLLRQMLDSLRSAFDHLLFRSACRIQSCFRTFTAKQLLHRLRFDHQERLKAEALLVLQSFTRMTIAKSFVRRHWRIRACLVGIEHRMILNGKRGAIARWREHTIFQKTKRNRSALVIECFIRICFAERVFKTLTTERDAERSSASFKLQRWWRGCYARKQVALQWSRYYTDSEKEITRQVQIKVAEDQEFACALGGFLQDAVDDLGIRSEDVDLSFFTSNYFLLESSFQ